MHDSWRQVREVPRQGSDRSVISLGSVGKGNSDTTHIIVTIACKTCFVAMLLLPNHASLEELLTAREKSRLQGFGDDEFAALFQHIPPTMLHDLMGNGFAMTVP